MKTNNNATLVGILLLGAGIGAAFGILFAPDRGSKTRRKISENGDDLADNLKGKYNNMIEKFKMDAAKAYGANSRLKSKKSFY